MVKQASSNSNRSAEKPNDLLSPPESEASAKVIHVAIQSLMSRADKNYPGQHSKPPEPATNINECETVEIFLGQCHTSGAKAS